MKQGYNIPEYTLEAIHRWVNHGILPGSFLESVLCSDLFSAVISADQDNLVALVDIVRYIYNECPGSCWGGPTAVKQWREKFDPDYKQLNLELAERQMNALATPGCITERERKRFYQVD